MRVSKDQAAQNRVAILQAASHLFRRQGIDGVGVAEIAREAGLTHGALYAHFPSKDALVAEAFSHGFRGNMAKSRGQAADAQRTFEDRVDRFLSSAMRDNLETGCPLAASASEISRHSPAVCKSFTDAFNEMAATLEASLETTIPISRRRKLAITAVSAQIGALAISRAVAKVDAGLADEVMQAVKKTIAAAHQCELARLE